VRLLDLFNSVGDHWGQNVLRLSDVHGTTLGYAILRAYEDPAIRAYLEHVAAWDAEHLGTGVPFEFFQRLAAALSVRSAETRAANAHAEHGAVGPWTLLSCCLPAIMRAARVHFRAHSRQASAPAVGQVASVS
jgi:hypothetical protein